MVLYTTFCLYRGGDNDVIRMNLCSSSILCATGQAKLSVNGTVAETRGGQSPEEWRLHLMQAKALGNTEVSRPEPCMCTN
jgi:hypothetical protein